MEPGNKYTNLSASGQVKVIRGQLHGMYVNSTTAGTIKIWNSLSATGDVINETITPAVGYHDLGDSQFSVGCFVTIGGALNVTMYTD